MDQLRAMSCLVQAQSFETLWAYYCQSDGHLYDAECRQAARALVASIRAGFTDDPVVSRQFEETTINKTPVAEIIDLLDGWASGDAIVPFENFSASRSLLFGLLSSTKLTLHVTLGIPVPPTISMSDQEIAHSERTLRWKGYLPDAILRNPGHDPDRLIKEASGAKTIAVIGDIRRSQQLMAYTGDNDRFSAFMGRFIDTSRKLITEHNGFFDKFTGDGFIAYFNESLISLMGRNYINCFLSFVRQEDRFVRKLFDDWRKASAMPLEEPIGLSLGCDIGLVDFRDVNNHLIAIGDAVVWAHRMCGVGEVGEVIAHDPLAEIIAPVRGLSLTQREEMTKNGIPFTPHAVTFDL